MVTPENPCSTETPLRADPSSCRTMGCGDWCSTSYRTSCLVVRRHYPDHLCASSRQRSRASLATTPVCAAPRRSVGWRRKGTGPLRTRVHLRSMRQNS